MVTTQINLEDIMQREISQTQEVKLCDLAHVWDLKTSGTWEQRADRWRVWECKEMLVKGSKAVGQASAEPTASMTTTVNNSVSNTEAGRLPSDP